MLLRGGCVKANEGSVVLASCTNVVACWISARALAFRPWESGERRRGDANCKASAPPLATASSTNCHRIGAHRIIRF
jgi:hypothetical protein